MTDKENGVKSTFDPCSVLCSIKNIKLAAPVKSPIGVCVTKFHWAQQAGKGAKGAKVFFIAFSLAGED